ncbi:twin-arginine translocation pathway signal protein [Maritimibacter sp. 55A14]|uniref:twin-arginine translocation signal domain-containing protein n=1 Tax=Maritimibacter sp. 55A14 TaxID=2174844 RepID=UPI000D6185FB|nr:twin-arginine translocation signal domain-containing protein [Maritimibacter sp. 55A14]PWE32573.1 twin-arginine translocation pathway signal protein [Maritimibacter sp. 55A14]
MSKKEESGNSRRDFLKLGLTAAPAAVATAALGSADTAEAASGAPEEGMQDTAHTRAYYESARF